MKKRSSATMILLFSMVSWFPAFAQSGEPVRTCSQAYDRCFAACAQRFPGVNETAARCIDKCTMARAKCDQGGCFSDNGFEACGLVRE
jgi:hypothetical protein